MTNILNQFAEAYVYLTTKKYSKDCAENRRKLFNFEQSFVVCLTTER